MTTEPCPNCQGGWLCEPCRLEMQKLERERSLAIAGTARLNRQDQITRVIEWFDELNDPFLLSEEEKAIHLSHRSNP